jgi:hypothetical protein
MSCLHAQSVADSLQRQVLRCCYNSCVSSSTCKTTQANTVLMGRQHLALPPVKHLRKVSLHAPSADSTWHSCRHGRLFGTQQHNALLKAAATAGL